MLRVTKTGGLVKIYPTAPRNPPHQVSRFPVVNNTLTIEKDPDIPADNWQEIVRQIVSSTDFRFPVDRASVEKKPDHMLTDIILKLNPKKIIDEKIIENNNVLVDS